MIFKQDKIVAELKEILGDSNRPVSMDDLPKMKYLERCIKESLRLYPPVHFISRSLNEEVTLSKYTYMHQNYYLHNWIELATPTRLLLSIVTVAS